MKTSIKPTTVRTVVNAERDKKLVHSETKNKTLPAPQDVLEEIRAGKREATVKFGTAVRIVQGFQSVEVSVGIEMPVFVTPGDFAEVKPWFQKAKELADEVIGDSKKDIDELSRRLAVRYGNQSRR